MLTSAWFDVSVKNIMLIDDSSNLLLSYNRYVLMQNEMSLTDISNVNPRKCAIVHLFSKHLCNRKIKSEAVAISFDDTRYCIKHSMVLCYFVYIFHNATAPGSPFQPKFSVCCKIQFMIQSCVLPAVPHTQ